MCISTIEISGSLHWFSRDYNRERLKLLSSRNVELNLNQDPMTNMQLISSRDGYLYAPPMEIDFDIQLYFISRSCKDLRKLVLNPVHLWPYTSKFPNTINPFIPMLDIPMTVTTMSDNL